MRNLIRALIAALPLIPLGLAAAVAAPPAAQAEDNGAGLTPALGWSSWSFIRHDPTAAGIEAQARAMKTSGLARAGYQYVNVDDFWYQCPGSQGPNVDQYGRWVTDNSKFPADGTENGIQVVADYVHHLGLKFGIYVTPGISSQAVAQNTPIEGTSYTADQIAEPSVPENNYNCGGMVGIDYSKPGAQAFIDSWADEFASWGVDYIKLDGVGSFDIPDVQAWSQALRQTGRPIHLELSNSLNIADASTWAQYSNGWRTGGDIECYGCETSGTSYPLTDWANVESRFDQVAQWQPYGGPGAFNDYDSLELGNGSNDGLTPAERQTQMSLWSLAASPLILGTDLTHLDPLDLSYLTNRAVLSVDQDSIDASRVADSAVAQVFAKTEKSGDVVAGLFNTSSQAEVVSTTAAAVGLPASNAYLLNDLWRHRLTESGPAIAADVPAHGVALFRIRPIAQAAAGLVPPDTTLAESGLATLTGGQPGTATVAFTNDGIQPVPSARLSLSAPAGWTVTPRSVPLGPVAPGATVQAQYHRHRTGAPGRGAVRHRQCHGGCQLPVDGAAKGKLGNGQRDDHVAGPGAIPDVFLGHRRPGRVRPVRAAVRDRGAGADLYSDADAYSSIYQPGVVGATATIETEVTAQQNMTGYAKAGLMVRNDITGSGTSPEGVILFESPSGGIQLEWDNNGGDFIDSVTPANGTIPESLPVYLELVRNGSTYTGYYSYDGASWLDGGQRHGDRAGGHPGRRDVPHLARGGPARAGHVQRLHG